MLQKKLISKLFYPFLLIILELVLFLANFTPKTFLVGWDNIMPEFNIPLNYMRAINSMWQEYRGLGTLDGMAHAANLLHTVYIHILSFFLPQNLLRFVFIHLTHILGGVALYFLAYRLFKNKHGAFTSAVFYLLNIAVIQMYFAPLEVFATHFAALPIMALALLSALNKTTKKSLLVLFGASVLTSPQGFVPTVFISYGILAALILAFSIGKTSVKKLGLVAAVIFISNAFWLLPFSYTALFKGSEIKDTRINEFSSDEIFYRNKARGTFQDVVTLKGFMLDTVEYDTFKKENFGFMQKWVDHISTFPVTVAQWIFALLMLIGSFAVIQLRIKALYPFLATNVISFFFLANNTPVLDLLNQLIRDYVPLFGEAFRFPFTKFITLYAFTYSLLLGLGVSYLATFLVNLFTKVLSHKVIAKTAYISVLAVCTFSIVYSSLPAFQGNFTSPYVRLALPKDYVDTMAYFKNEPSDGRILTFPMHTFWNWEYRTWGHRGSGFLWYGIPQPLVIRPFDPWSNYNEQLFNEFSSAYQSNDIVAFDNLLKKHEVRYILIDTTVLNTITPKPIDYSKVDEFLGRSGLLVKDKVLGKNTIYKTKEATNAVFTTHPDGTFSTYPAITQSTSDSVIAEGNYINSSNPDLVFPLASLATLKLPKDNMFNWKYDIGKLELTSKLKGNDISGSSLVVPSLFRYEFLIPVKITRSQNTVILTPAYPQIKLNGKVIEVPVEPIVIQTQIVSEPTRLTFTDTNQTVDLTTQTHAFIINNYLNTIRLNNGTTEEFVQIDTSAFSKETTVVTLDEKRLDSFEVTIPLFDTELGKANYVSNNQYVVTSATEGAKLKQKNKEV